MQADGEARAGIIVGQGTESTYFFDAVMMWFPSSFAVTLNEPAAIVAV